MKELLTAEAKLFIQENLDKDVAELALKTHGKHDSMGFLLQQIRSRQKAKQKIPSWYANADILFPQPLSVEQASSELTARYKANLISAATLFDMTGGMGLDASSFATSFEQVYYCDRSEDLARTFSYNCEVLGLKNITSIVGDSISQLKRLGQKFDVVYVDPARRKEDQRVFQFEDCEPNLLEIGPLLFDYTSEILIKASPMVDIKLALKQLQNVSQVHVVAVNNECKEVLFVQDKKSVRRTEIISTDLRQDFTLSFDYKEEHETVVEYGDVGKYLYIPNVAISKAGAFNTVASRYGLQKMSRNTHLYSSARFVKGFPGRVIQTQEVLEYSKRTMRYYHGEKMNVLVRNFALSVANLRKKWSIKDGGEKYLIAFTDHLNKKRVAVGTLLS